MLVHTSAQGHKHGTFQTRTLVLEYDLIAIGHRTWTAIAWTTAAALVAVVELVSHGTLSQRGFVKREDIPLLVFLHTMTGHLFAAHHPTQGAL